MAIIKRKRGNVIYIYESIYEGIENGKQKYKEKCLGHLDEAGNLIPSKKNRRNDAPEAKKIKTQTPEELIMEKSKAGNVTFNENERLYNKPVKIAMEKKGSDKQISTLVALNFNEQEMNERGLTIRTSKQLTPFDRIILDAITTLYVEGKNEYITLTMIFNVITGEPKTMSENFAQEINDSITKMMYTRILIKADEEACMYKELKDFKYDSTLLPAERISAKLNGTITTCIHLFRTPPLYDYANRKKQIARLNISILAKPFQDEKRENKTWVILKFYLVRRIIALGRVHIKRASKIIASCIIETKMISSLS